MVGQLLIVCSSSHNRLPNDKHRHGRCPCAKRPHLKFVALRLQGCLYPVNILLLGNRVLMQHLRMAYVQFNHVSGTAATPQTPKQHAQHRGHRQARGGGMTPGSSVIPPMWSLYSPLRTSQWQLWQLHPLQVPGRVPVLRLLAKLRWLPHAPEQCWVVALHTQSHAERTCGHPMACTIMCRACDAHYHGLNSCPGKLSAGSFYRCSIVITCKKSRRTAMGCLIIWTWHSSWFVQKQMLDSSSLDSRWTP